MNTVIAFADLFEGRLDAYGTEQGGSLKPDEHSRSRSHYHDRIARHLRGTEPMGTYPWLDGQVRWGCVDFDEGEDESWAHAQNVRQLLDAFGITAWVERSRSKGYHVWIFMDEWTDATLVRRALLGACQTVKAPTKEINPKSWTLAEGQLGNYVRLPYPGHVCEHRRLMCRPDGRPIPLDEFVASATLTPTFSTELEPVADLYIEPPSVVPAHTAVPSTLGGDAVHRMTGLAWTIFDKGPMEGSDRSGTLYKLARKLGEDGRHTHSEAIDLVWDADGRWGKFHDRSGGYQKVVELVAAAWR